MHNSIQCIDKEGDIEIVLCSSIGCGLNDTPSFWNFTVIYI